MARLESSSISLVLLLQYFVGVDRVINSLHLLDQLFLHIFLQFTAHLFLIIQAAEFGPRGSQLLSEIFVLVDEMLQQLKL